MAFDDTSPAPPAPPLPPPRGPERETNLKLKTKERAAGDKLFRSRSNPNPDPPPTGHYFVYGTLMDQPMLKDILDLPHKPSLRPGRMVGYRKRSWGQYPAIVKRGAEQEVLGMVYDVTTAAHGRRLAEYETSNYRVEPVVIEFTDGLEPTMLKGWVFVFDGRGEELGDADFVLQNWLTSVGRGPQ